jgi:hypothetical protein
MLEADLLGSGLASFAPFSEDDGIDFSSRSPAFCPLPLAYSCTLTPARWQELPHDTDVGLHFFAPLGFGSAKSKALSQVH